MFLMRIYLALAFNDPSSNFLDFDLDHLTFKLLIFFTNFFNYLYKPFIQKKRLLTSNRRRFSKRPFPRLSNLSLILYHK